MDAREWLGGEGPGGLLEVGDMETEADYCGWGTVAPNIKGI